MINVVNENYNMDASNDRGIDERFAEASILFDIYGGLLTEKKQRVMELYHEENLSLSEIAEEQGISRAAVHDALKSAEHNLREYENKLGIAADYANRQKLALELRKAIQNLVSGESQRTESNNSDTLAKIEKLLSRLEE